MEQMPCWGYGNGNWTEAVTQQAYDRLTTTPTGVLDLFCLLMHRFKQGLLFFGALVQYSFIVTGVACAFFSLAIMSGNIPEGKRSGGWVLNLAAFTVLTIYPPICLWNAQFGTRVTQIATQLREEHGDAEAEIDL